MKIETQCLHSGYNPKNGESHVMPITQSTTYRFESAQHMADLFDMPTEHIYSRISNPTCDIVEKKIAELEGGVLAMLTSSGQAASLLSILNVCSAGDSFISSSAIYGGTVNLFCVSLKKFGIECIMIDQDASEEEIQKAIKPNTRAFFTETVANPALIVADLEKLAKIAHKNNIPLIVDNTFPTPVLCKPFEFGADIVVHATTKYMEGHSTYVGGVIVDSGNFDWEKANIATRTDANDPSTGFFADFVLPDESYHGLIYTKSFGNLAYLCKARMQLIRDFGCYATAQGAFALNIGLETLPLRMERVVKNAQTVAEYFQNSDKIEEVIFPGLKGDKNYDRAQKYLPNGTSGVIGVVIKGGREAAVRFIDSLKLASNCVHVADIKTMVLHPASCTHRQLTEEQLISAGCVPGLVRFSCGLENIDDIIADIQQALESV